MTKDHSEEISIDYERDDESVTIMASLGEASILVEGDPDSDDFKIIVNSTAAIVNAVGQAIANNNQQEES